MNRAIRPKFVVLRAVVIAAVAAGGLTTPVRGQTTPSSGPASSPVLLPPVAGAVLPGWQLPVLGPTGAQWAEGRSGDGRTQILVEPGSDERGPSGKNTTRFAVVRLTTKGKPIGQPRVLTFDGRFGYDAISNAGTRLFVTENRDVEAPGTYRVRMIDLTTGTLDPRILSDRPVNSEAFNGSENPEIELMYGSAMKRVRNPLRTHWIFTLYDAPGKHPFVHALNTEGFALCVDLPKHGKKVSELATTWRLTATSNTVSISNPGLDKAWQFDIGSTALRSA